jgi:hypothetical protein
MAIKEKGNLHITVDIIDFFFHPLDLHYNPQKWQRRARHCEYNQQINKTVKKDFFSKFHNAKINNSKIIVTHEDQ